MVTMVDCVVFLVNSFSLYNFNADLEWKLIYVGSAEDETYDQLLESVLADPPDPSKIREEDIMAERGTSPEGVDRQGQRNILSDKPRVTKFPINFHPENKDPGDQPPPPDHPAETDGNREEPPASTHHPQMPDCRNYYFQTLTIQFSGLSIAW
ncbi:putative histone chaperone ASF1A [Vitis vinifera]|uniref:Putative histone chaperone ASF1A n=1 Tax=Vitis vinifera TaxID=29760 RepID=A0A438HTI0_VITVI|nr:putative histone chaperone ASF1A [Vitis vinifera]